ncbi:hypothetical protein [Pseudoponticoccus marisrubri]|uniref:PH domain-containing protein n=1 Tax=Pseudoponticoccus marisrubri TaxID=1685382 RepID=A0A0W7WPU4_9RHOB|nr:hypothetical protein [Pseudoponticoccus marisrubri]KUF12607.1 hypothetical protein AVJ23_02485 [Pseudoponticoccus marisrubri]
MSDGEVMRISASGPRRVIGVGALVGLGALLLYMALGTPEMAMPFRLGVGLGGALALWVSQLMWEVTGHALILTETDLRDSDGTVIARLDDIARVDRGAFAMKPSNGFLIVLKTSGPRAWRPGLWWRLGRRVAVGGVTAGSQTRPMADVIKVKIAEARGEAG